MGSPSQDLSKHTEAEESPWIGLPSVRPAHRNSSLVIRMQLTAPWRVPLRSAYPTAPKAKAVEDHFLCSWMLCLPGICFHIHAKPTSLQVSFQGPGYLGYIATKRHPADRLEYPTQPGKCPSGRTSAHAVMTTSTPTTSLHITLSRPVCKVYGSIHVDVSGQRGEGIETVRLSWE